MPKVGSKHFAYTDAGEAAAHAEAKSTGKQVEKAYAKGGSVKGAKKKSSKKKSSKKKKSSTKAPAGYVVARGSGAARPQFFKVNT